MKPGGSKQKGNKFENDIAKRIRAIAMQYKFDEECCYRSAGSGGHRFVRKTDPGDLVISPELTKYFPFSVECKNVITLELHHFLDDEFNKSKYLERQWVKQVCAAAGDRIPLLVFKKNNLPVFAAGPETEVCEWLGDYKPLHYMSFRVDFKSWILFPFTIILDCLDTTLKYRVTAKRRGV